MTDDRSQRAGPVGESLRIAVPVLILVAGAVGAFVLSRQGEAPARVVEKEQAPLVETVPVAVQEGGLDIEVDGVVVPYREIELASEVDGRIDHKADVCRAGSYVTGGTLLLRVDPRDYELDRDRLGKEVAQAEASCRELEAEIENTEALIELAERQLNLQDANFKRQKSLHADGVASDSELDLAEQGRLQAENALLTLRSQLQVLRRRSVRLKAAKEHADVLLKKAELDLERTEIRCPKDTNGVVVSDLVEQDDYVRKGSPLVTIEDTSKVEVKCSLRVDELYWLWNQTGLGPGEDRQAKPQVDYEIPRVPVTVVYRLAGREYQWDGVLSRYEGIGLDESTRTVPCRVLVGAPREVCVKGSEVPSGQCTGPPALVRGMYVTVRIHAEPQAKLVRIPEAAVRPGNKVWVVRDGKLAIVEVRVVRVTDEAAIIRAGGLDAGERAVVTPLPVAEHGMAVREQRAP